MDKKSRLGVERDPLVALRRVAAEIPQSEDVVDRQRIDADTVPLPAIAEVEILSDLDRRKNEKRAVIAGPQQDTFILALAAVHENPRSEKELEKGAVFGRHVSVGIDTRV